MRRANGHGPCRTPSDSAKESSKLYRPVSIVSRMAGGSDDGGPSGFGLPDARSMPSRLTRLVVRSRLLVKEKAPDGFLASEVASSASSETWRVSPIRTWLVGLLSTHRTRAARVRRADSKFIVNGHSSLAKSAAVR
jgi:hypothetical protein